MLGAGLSSYSKAMKTRNVVGEKKKKRCRAKKTHQRKIHKRSEEIDLTLSFAFSAVKG